MYQGNAFDVTVCTTVFSKAVWWRCLLLDSTIVEHRRSINRIFICDWSADFFVTKVGQTVSQLCEEMWVRALGITVDKTTDWKMWNIVVKVHYCVTYCVMWSLWGECEGVKHTHSEFVVAAYTRGRMWDYSIYTCDCEAKVSHTWANVRLHDTHVSECKPAI